MASPKTKGRMIRRDVSLSHKIASLSEKSGFLFFMIIPHLNSYGKLNGSPNFIKGEVVPLIEWFTVPVIERCLQEISDKTNVKWFERGGLWFLHSVNWEDHQKLEEKKRGADELPSWNGTGEHISPQEEPPAVTTKRKDPSSKYEYPDDFMEFWNAYPRHENKSQALKEWEAEKKHNPKFSQEEVVSAAKEYALEVSGKDVQFIKMPSTFLHAGTWMEKVSLPPPPPAADAPDEPPDYRMPRFCPCGNKATTIIDGEEVCDTCLNALAR